MNTDNEVKKSKFPVFIRVLALILVVIIIGDLLLVNVVSVDYSADTYEGEAEDMAQYIARTDEYINEGFIYRVRNAVRAAGTPETFEDYYMCASIAIADNDLDKAAEYLDKCIELFIGDDSTLSMLNLKQGCILAMNDKWAQSQKYFEHAAALDATSPDAFIMLAQAAYQNESYDTAVEAMKKYSALSEMTARQYALLVSMQLFNGDYADAAETCGKALELEDSSRADMLFMRCKANYFLENYEDCRNDAQGAVDAGYDYNEGMTMKAAAYEGEKDYAGVLSVLMEMIDRGVEDGTVYQNALTCAFEVDDFAAQEKILLQLLEYETDAETELTLRSSLAMAQLNLNKFSEAMNNFNFCIEAQPDNVQLIYLRGVCLMNLLHYNEAYKDFSTVLEADELIDECYYNRAICRLGLNQKVAARSELNEIIRRNANGKMVALAQELLDSN